MIMPVSQKERDLCLCAPNFLDVYVCNISALRDNSKLYASAYNMLPDFRKKKADNYVFAKDKALSVGAWLLLQYAMKQHNLTDFEKHITYTQYEKPYLKDKRIHFNLSHSGSYVMCVASNKPVGCDVQSIEPLDDALIDYCLNKSEQKIIKQFVSDSLLQKSADCALENGLEAQAFYRLWTLKEALMKTEGSGLNIAPKEICFSAIDAQHNHYSYSCKPIQAQDYSFKEFFEISNYCASICSCIDTSCYALNIVKIVHNQNDILGKTHSII